MNSKIFIPQILFLLTLIFEVHTGKCALPQEEFKRGAGNVMFTSYTSLGNRPITLYYYIPTKGDVRNMKILFSMHGAERSGRTQRNTWQNLAEEFGFVVLAPEFTQENGYPNNDYQFGGISRSSKSFELKPRETWTFSVIEMLFDYFKDKTGNLSDNYQLFGHSGGGQFVQRFLLSMPDARVGRAVVANPGSYAFLDATSLYQAGGAWNVSEWPYFIVGTPFDSFDYLIPYFAKDMVFMVGTLDTASVPANLKASHPINLQGRNRYERAHHFFATSKSLALEHGVSFEWQFKEVQDVGHSTSKMLYGHPNLRSHLIEDNHRVYNNEDLTAAGAFEFLKRFLFP